MLPQNKCWPTQKTSTPAIVRSWTFHEALLAAESLGDKSVIIRICPGIYVENIEIRSQKKLKLIGDGEVILAGTGTRKAIVDIQDTCLTHDFCFGEVSFENINICILCYNTMENRSDRGCTI